MKRFLGNNEFLDRIGRTELPAKLRSLISSNVVEAGGCFFLEPFYDSGMDMEHLLQQLQDRTGVECFVNHIHVSDYVDSRTGSDPIRYLVTGLRYACLLQSKLKIIGGFEIIVSYGEDEIPDCTVHFHKTRENEKYLLDELDEYRDEAILVLRG